MKKVLLVAHDVGPSEALALISDVIKARSGETLEFLSYGKGSCGIPSESVVNTAVSYADVALLGMSFPKENAELELLFGKAMISAKKPVALFADTFGAWTREYFSTLREDAAIVFTAGNEQGARLFFSRASIHGFGNPTWDKYFIPASRKDARKMLGVSSDDFVILAPGAKDPVANILFWGTIAEAMKKKLLSAMTQFRIFFARHPGDKTDQNLYDSLLSLADNAKIEFLSSRIRSDDVVPGVDCVIHQGNSSVGLHALCRGIQVIDCPAPLADEFIKERTGGWEYTPCKSGATIHPRGIPDLAHIIDFIARGERVATKEFLKERELGRCAARIASILLRGS